MPVLLSDEELQALEGLPHLHRCLYIFGIRRYMDYATGLTGIKRKVSYKSLSEEIYIDIRRGVKEDSTKSRDQVKRALAILEKKKLIERKSIVTKDEKQLILRCLLAHTDNNVKNKAAPWPPHSPAPQAAPLESEINPLESTALEDIDNESRPVSRPTQIVKAAPHPISDTLHNITLHCADENLPVDNSKPNAQDFLQLLARQGYYVNKLHGNKKTLAMINVWVTSDVSLEEAQIGVKHVNEQLGKPPDSPTYYLKPVLQVRKDFEHAQKQAHEVQHDKRQSQQSTATVKSRYPKSATKQFWENTEAVLRGFLDD